MAKSKKKILILYQDWGNWFVDDYKVFEYWFKELDRGYSVVNEYYIFSLGNYNKKFQKEKNIYVELFKSSPKSQFIDLFKYKTRAKEVIEEFKPDYVYSPFIYLFSAVKKSKDYKTIGFLRAYDAKIVKSNGGLKWIFGNIFYLLDYLAFKNIDLLLYNGKNVLDYAKFFRFKGESKYFPRPIADAESFKNSECDDVVKKYDLKNKKVILTVGRISDEKNFKFCLKAFSLLNDDYIYMIIGVGEEMQNLRDYAKKLKVLDRVYFVGNVKHKNIWTYYKCANVFWLMSKTEVAPNVLKEALFAKVPIIVSKIKPMRNVVSESYAYILKSWDVQELSKKTINLVVNKKLYSSFIKKGYSVIIKDLKLSIKLSEVFK